MRTSVHVNIFLIDLKRISKNTRDVTRYTIFYKQDFYEIPSVTDGYLFPGSIYILTGKYKIFMN